MCLLEIYCKTLTRCQLLLVFFLSGTFLEFLRVFVEIVIEKKIAGFHETVTGH